MKANQVIMFAFCFFLMALVPLSSALTVIEDDTEDSYSVEGDIIDGYRCVDEDWDNIGCHFMNFGDGVIVPFFPPFDAVFKSVYVYENYYIPEGTTSADVTVRYGFELIGVGKGMFDVSCWNGSSWVNIFFDDTSEWSSTVTAPTPSACLSFGEYHQRVVLDTFVLLLDGQNIYDSSVFAYYTESKVDWYISPIVDSDGDGIPDDEDNCEDVFNANQTDTDEDEIGDVCDECIFDPDNDIDGDGLCADVDECPEDPYNDQDEDEYCEGTAYGGDCIGGGDSDDEDPTVYPNAKELCDNKDNDGNGLTDEELVQDCGQGSCTGTQMCIAGVWGDCSSSGQDAGVCAVCDVSGVPLYDGTQDADCDDGAWCNGEETCLDVFSCQSGVSPDCSVNDLVPVGTCSNSPDDNPFTWDLFVGFVSVCDEGANACTAGVVELTHICSVDDCSAECDHLNDCADTECDGMDACYNGTYMDYNDVPNACTDGCLCTDNVCDAYDEIVTDADRDGYDIECDGDCDDSDPLVNLDAFEIPGNGVDENCDGALLCDPLAEWKNHGKFVSCVAHEAERLLEEGLITEEEKDAMVSEAAKSDVGKKKSS